MEAIAADQAERAMIAPPEVEVRSGRATVRDARPRPFSAKGACLRAGDDGGRDFGDEDGGLGGVNERRKRDKARANFGDIRLQGLKVSINSL